MSRISVYVPQIAVPQLSGPRLEEINVSGGIAGALKTVNAALEERELRRGSERPPDGETDEAADGEQPPTGHTHPAAAVSQKDAVSQKEGFDGNVYAANALAKLIAKGLDFAASNPEERAGHTLDAISAFKKDAIDALAAAPNELAKQKLAQGLPGAQLEVHKTAVSAEVSANLRKRYADAMETLDIFGGLVKADPSQLPERMAEALALGENLIMATYERAAYNAKRRELPLIALSTVIERDPRSALTDMKEGRWSPYVDKKTLAWMRTHAEQGLEQRQSAANSAKAFDAESFNQQLTRYGRSLVDANEQSLRDVQQFAPDALNATLGSKAAQIAGDRLAAQRDIGTFLTHAVTATTAELDEMHEQNKATGETPTKDDTAFGADAWDSLLPSLVLRTPPRQSHPNRTPYER